MKKKVEEKTQPERKAEGPANTPNRKVIAVLPPDELDSFQRLHMLKIGLDIMIKGLGEQSRKTWELCAKKHKIDLRLHEYKVDAETGELYEVW